MKLMGLAVGLFVIIGLNGATVGYAQEREGPAVTRIPGGQEVCSFGNHVIPSTAFTGVPGVVTVNNGSAPKINVVQFSSEAFASAGTNINVRLSIDGGGASIFGAEFFHNGAGEFETVTGIWTVPLPAGVHTIQVFAQKTSAAGSASLFFRCLTTEKNTK